MKSSTLIKGWHRYEWQIITFSQMHKNTHSLKMVNSRRSHRSKRNSRRKNVLKRIITRVKKDPVKIFAVFFGGILLVVITILFILYANDIASKKNQLQKIESK